MTDPEILLRAVLHVENIRNEIKAARTRDEHIRLTRLAVEAEAIVDLFRNRNKPEQDAA